MSRFSIDYKSLENNTINRTYRYEDVKHKLQKVAFDIVRFRQDNNDNIDGLWKIEATDSGDVIVALYDEGDVLEKTSSSWDASLNKSASEISVFYKNDFITKIASSELGINDVESFVEGLPARMDKNSKLKEALLKELPVERRQEIVSKYPELK